MPNYGLQQNNYSQMGYGQPQTGKDSAKRKGGFMSDMGYDEPIFEATAPGIPSNNIDSTLGNRASGQPTSHTYGQPAAAQAVTAQTPQTYSPQIFQGFTPAQTMHGFDFAREQNTGKSAKDAFAFLSNEAAKQGHAAPLNGGSKDQYGNWFNTYIKPGFNQLGHNAQDAVGDKFRFSNWQGTYDVDFGENAGAQGALAWMADDANAPKQLPKTAPSNDIYQKAQQQLMATPQNSGDLDALVAALMQQNQELI